MLIFSSAHFYVRIYFSIFFVCCVCPSSHCRRWVSPDANGNLKGINRFSYFVEEKIERKNKNETSNCEKNRISWQTKKLLKSKSQTVFHTTCTKCTITKRFIDHLCYLFWSQQKMSLIFCFHLQFRFAIIQMPEILKSIRDSTPKQRAWCWLILTIYRSRHCDDADFCAVFARFTWRWNSISLCTTVNNMFARNCIASISHSVSVDMTSTLIHSFFDSNSWSRNSSAGALLVFSVWQVVNLSSTM